MFLKPHTLAQLISFTALIKSFCVPTKVTIKSLLILLLIKKSQRDE